MLTIDGRVGEGGGQLVRTAAALSALSGQPLRFDNVRGNRSQGGAAIQWLADATGAATTGIHTGSTAFTFTPSHCRLPAGCSSPDRPIVLRAATEAASAALMLQAVLPYILFGEAAPAAAEAAESKRETAADAEARTTAVYLTLHGGTHVANAPTYDYLDQVLFPTLEDWFGVRVERDMVQRCWNAGPANSESGHINLVIHRPAQLVPRFPSLAPVVTGKTRKTADKPSISEVHATVYAPSEVLEQLIDALSREVSLCDALSRPDLQFRTVQDSGHGTRVYVLLVACTAGDAANNVPVRRWGRDYLGRGNILKGTHKGRGPPGQSKRGSRGSSQLSRGGRGKEQVPAPAGLDLSAACDRIAQKVVGYLAADVEAGGCGDEYLQDQVVVFQALAAGQTSFWCGQQGVEKGEKEEKEEEEEKEERKNSLLETVARLTLDGKKDALDDDMSAPSGEGSLHAATARWVTAQLLPRVQWSSNGTVCRGVSWSR